MSSTTSMALSSTYGSSYSAERICHPCGQKNSIDLRVCSACKNRWYCSIECQRGEWSSHQKECKIEKKVVPLSDKTLAAVNSKPKGSEKEDCSSEAMLRQAFHSFSLSTTGRACPESGFPSMFATFKEASVQVEKDQQEILRAPRKDRKALLKKLIEDRESKMKKIKEMLRGTLVDPLKPELAGPYQKLHEAVHEFGASHQGSSDPTLKADPSKKIQSK